MSTARRVKAIGLLVSLVIHVSAVPRSLRADSRCSARQARGCRELSAAEMSGIPTEGARTRHRRTCRRGRRMSNHRRAATRGVLFSRSRTSRRATSGCRRLAQPSMAIDNVRVCRRTPDDRAPQEPRPDSLWPLVQLFRQVLRSILAARDAWQQAAVPSSATTTAVVPAVSSTMAQDQPAVSRRRDHLAWRPHSPTPGSAGWVGLAILSLWACGFAAIVVLRSRMWWRIRRAVHISAAVEIPPVVLPPHVQVRAAPGLMEPGVVGFWRPIILLPAGIEEHLTPAQLEAVLAHELCHVRRRDNLTAARAHARRSGVLVPSRWCGGSEPDWWTSVSAPATKRCSARSIEPRAYAEGILNVCKRYVDARLACVSGVSGSDLKAESRQSCETSAEKHWARGESSFWRLPVSRPSTAPMVIGSLGAPPSSRAGAGAPRGRAGIRRLPRSSRTNRATLA